MVRSPSAAAAAAAAVVVAAAAAHLVVAASPLSASLAGRAASAGAANPKPWRSIYIGEAAVAAVAVLVVARRQWHRRWRRRGERRRRRNFSCYMTTDRQTDKDRLSVSGTFEARRQRRQQQQQARW